MSKPNITLALLLVACGPESAMSAVQGQPETSLDGGVDAAPQPIPDNALRFDLDMPDIPAGTDTNVCVGYAVEPGLAFNGIAWRFRSDGVHHLGVWATAAGPFATKLCGNTGMPGDYTVIGTWARGTQDLDIGDVAVQLPEGTKSIGIGYHVLGPIAAGPIGELYITPAEAPKQLAQITLIRAGTPEIQPRTTGARTWECPITADAQLYFGWPHMHALGTTFTATIGGRPLVSIAEWDADHQRLYPFNTSAKAGEKVSITCTWNNTTDRVVRFGPTVADEMCSLAFGVDLGGAGLRCYAPGTG